jgi:protein subunit release factor A
MCRSATKLSGRKDVQQKLSGCKDVRHKLAVYKDVRHKLAVYKDVRQKLADCKDVRQNRQDREQSLAAGQKMQHEKSGTVILAYQMSNPLFPL